MLGSRSSDVRIRLYRPFPLLMRASSRNTTIADLVGKRENQTLGEYIDPGRLMLIGTLQQATRTLRTLTPLLTSFLQPPFSPLAPCRRLDDRAHLLFPFTCLDQATFPSAGKQKKTCKLSLPSTTPFDPARRHPKEVWPFFLVADSLPLSELVCSL
jgi:hypothetical protein